MLGIRLANASSEFRMDIPTSTSADLAIAYATPSTLRIAASRAGNKCFGAPAQFQCLVALAMAPSLPMHIPTAAARVAVHVLGACDSALECAVRKGPLMTTTRSSSQRMPEWMRGCCWWRPRGCPSPTWVLGACHVASAARNAANDLA
mmetsp:Transcript_43871/g.103753  ORF Transcript_43871/g.103753 Transcript_43871/m.103753 type:complete len:148 (+) Transcript_43871:868-1311(+)